MRIYATLLAVSVALAPLPAFAQSFPTSDMRHQLEDTSTAMMIEALEQAQDGILNPIEGPILRLPQICPHAMRALAAISAGVVDMDTGSKLFFAGLVQDQADFMVTKMTGAPSLNLEKAGITLQVKPGAKVDAKQLVAMLEAGQAFLK